MKVLFLFYFLLFATHLLAQVNLQTGAATFNIPIFSYSDKNGLNCEASLNYTDGNGLKVNEVASNVGTGWNLNCGGVIERVQNGEPDDQKRPESITYQLATATFANDSYYPNGYLYSKYSSTDIVDNNAAISPLLPGTSFAEYITYPKYSEDREQDFFNFSFNGRHGTFVIGKKGQIQILGDSKLVISKVDQDQSSLNIRTTISSFTVTDENGIQYIFSDEILSEVCKYDKVSNALNGNVLKDDGLSTYGSDRANCPSCTFQFKFYQARKLHQYIVSSWCLTKILNPRTGKYIAFNYENFDIDFRGNKSLQLGQMAGRSVMSILQHRNIIKSKRLIQILTPESKTYYFLYDRNVNRVDIPDDKALISISYELNNVPVYSFSFKYGYFFQNQIRDYNYPFNNNPSEIIYARLCLLSFQKNGYDGSNYPPYVFSYNTSNTGIVIPPLFSFDQDQFGYFTKGQGVMPTLFFDANQNQFNPGNYNDYANLLGQPDFYRIITPGMAKYGIIKTIKYPLGGELSFEYEQRDALFNNQNVLIGGVRVIKTSLYDGNDHHKDIITNYNYHDAANNSSGWGYELPIYSKTKSVRIYKTTSSSIGLSDFKGFAVSNIKSYFSNLNENGNLNSSAFQTALKNNVANQIIQSVCLMVLTGMVDLFQSDYQDYTNTSISYDALNNNIIKPQYSLVEVTKSLLSGTNGKTVYEFTKPDQIQLLEEPYPNKQRLADWIYGLPLRTSIYNYQNNTYSLVKTTEYQYSNSSHSLTDPDFLSNKWQAISPQSYPYSYYTYLINGGPNPDNRNILSDIYYPVTGHSDLISTVETDYNLLGNFLKTTRQFGYNSSNLNLNYTKEINSNGDIIEHKLFYPSDYNNIGIFGSMINNNLILPISEETWITKNNTVQPLLIKASSTGFDFINNGDIKPVIKYELESAGPLNSNAILPFNPNSSVRDPNYIKPQQQILYDNYGNVIQTISSNKVSGILYDNSERLIVMNIVNAKSGEYAYTSFESLNTGGWNYNIANTIKSQCPTGKSCYQLSGSNPVSTNLIILKPSILSFWSTNNNILVNGSFSPTKTINTIPGWTYYEFLIPANTSFISITGNSLLDELRLYPNDAQMSTITYDDFDNVTSSCDMNNRIQYFETDGLQRPLLIRDQNKNVLKKFCYNFAGQLENCSVIYKNQTQSKIFSFQPCDANHLAAQIQYTVPSGKYISYYSLDDANQQAQNEISSNGQNFANLNGFCVPKTIYARLTFENQIGNQADIVIRFYQDNAGTIPYSVNNFNVSIQEIVTNYTTGLDTYNTYLISCNGNTSIALSSVLLYEQLGDPAQTELERYYYLLPDVAYTIIN